MSSVEVDASVILRLCKKAIEEITQHEYRSITRFAEDIKQRRDWKRRYIPFAKIFIADLSVDQIIQELERNERGTFRTTVLISFLSCFVSSKTVNTISDIRAAADFALKNGDSRMRVSCSELEDIREWARDEA